LELWATAAVGEINPATPADAEAAPNPSAATLTAMTAGTSHALRITDLHELSIKAHVAHFDMGGDTIARPHKVNCDLVYLGKRRELSPIKLLFDEIGNFAVMMILITSV
jgi:hypothetical protein